MEELKEVVQIIDKNKHYIMFVFNTGVRELYEITEHKNLNNLEDVRKLGKFSGIDYSGNEKDAPPMPYKCCQMCSNNVLKIEKQRSFLLQKEEELLKREEELDFELSRIRKF